MSSCVLDASAVMCLIRREPGSDAVAAHLPASIVSAVNLSEVFAKARDFEMSLEAMKWIMDGLKIQVVSFDEEQAYVAGSLREPTRSLGLSFGDRACLALGLHRGLPVVTTETRWSQLSIGIDVRQVR